MKVSVTVCDVCQGVGVQADRYEVKVNGERKAFDLCEEDAAPLTTFVGQFPRGKRLGRPAASSAASAPKVRARASNVVTLDEIEAQKKAPAKKRAVKKVAAAKS